MAHENEIGAPDYGERKLKAIAIFNPRGGSGKTSVTINLSAGLAKLGKKSLIMDFDPQSHLTYVMNKNMPDNYISLYDFIEGKAALNEIIYQHEKCDYIPSNLLLYNSETSVTYKKIKKLIEKSLLMLEGYDFVLIDCSPSLGLFNNCIINTVTDIISPTTFDIFTENTISNLMCIISSIKNKTDINHRIVVNRYNDDIFNIAKYVGYIRNRYTHLLYNRVIRESIDITKSIINGKNIFDYDSNSMAAHDYLEFSREVISSFK